MIDRVTETFFLPNEIGRIKTRIPADLYNTSRNLLVRNELDSVFVPIRSLQVFGVITEGETVFVDSLSYAHVDNEGGRIVKLGWEFMHTSDRAALNAPVDCEVVYYHEDGKSLQERMIMEFRAALETADKRYRNEAMPAEGARIVRLNKVQG